MSEAKEQQNTLIKRKFGEFLPNADVDPTKIYLQWKQSIFGDQEADDSVMYFVLSQAKAAGIDPRIPRQIYAVGFKNRHTGKTKYTVIIGIEGLVTIAENTGQYGGTTKPEFEYDEQGNLKSCTVGVHKVVKGVPVVSYQTVEFDEYYAPVKGGKDTLWKSKPKTMLKKVAHAHALRATFSACAGMYVEEEMDRDVIDVEATPDIKEDIKNAKDLKELQKILAGLDIEDKKRVANLASEKMKELNNATTK